MDLLAGYKGDCDKRETLTSEESMTSQPVKMAVVGCGALFEIYGTEGTVSLPDPNTFAGPVRVRRIGETEWRDIPLTHAHTENSRGIGIADMAEAIRRGRPHRANGHLGLHVLDTVHAVLEASETGRHIKLTSTCDRPAPLPTGLPERVLDA